MPDATTTQTSTADVVHTETIRLWTAPALASLPWLAHGVTERGGGVGEGAFASLNLGLHVGDDPARVVENRRRAAEALGFSLDAVVCAEQVHGAGVACVGAAHAGRGARAHADSLPEADALATDRPGLLLTLFFADCVPVLLADPTRRAVAVAHGGWRGLDAGVLKNTVDTMAASFGSEPDDMLAAIGPCIGACCYEVGDEVAQRFPPEYRNDAGEKPHLDLAGIAAGQLRLAGLRSESIAVAGHCTACHPEYFSHRRDAGRTGRIGALIGIRPTGTSEIL